MRRLNFSLEYLLRHRLRCCAAYRLLYIHVLCRLSRVNTKYQHDTLTNVGATSLAECLVLPDTSNFNCVRRRRRRFFFFSLNQVYREETSEYQQRLYYCSSRM